MTFGKLVDSLKNYHAMIKIFRGKNSRKYPTGIYTRKFQMNSGRWRVQLSAVGKCPAVRK